jgi:uncharacterized protein (DUF3820 family)
MMITFGKHCGKPIEELPTDYLQWMVVTLDDRPELVLAAKAELTARGEPIPVVRTFTGDEAAALVVTFGKHQGKRIDHVPSSYLAWLMAMVRKDHLELASAAKVELSARLADNPSGQDRVTVFSNEIHATIDGLGESWTMKGAGDGAMDRVIADLRSEGLRVQDYRQGLAFFQRNGKLRLFNNGKPILTWSTEAMSRDAIAAMHREVERLHDELGDDACLLAACRAIDRVARRLTAPHARTTD